MHTRQLNLSFKLKFFFKWMQMYFILGYNIYSAIDIQDKMQNISNLPFNLEIFVRKIQQNRIKSITPVNKARK